MSPDVAPVLGDPSLAELMCGAVRRVLWTW
jgi:hypothetical protein